MEPKDLLLFPQEPDTSLSPQPDEYSPCSPTLLYILLLSCHECLGIPCGLLTSPFPAITLYAFLFSLMCATCPTYLILLHLITLIIFGKDINHKSPHRKFSLASCYFLLCRSKYLPQHSVLAYLQCMFFPQCDLPRSTPL